jgi:hypothetical protein
MLIHIDYKKKNIWRKKRIQNIDLFYTDKNFYCKNLI